METGPWVGLTLGIRLRVGFSLGLEVFLESIGLELGIALFVGAVLSVGLELGIALIVGAVVTPSVSAITKESIQIYPRIRTKIFNFQKNIMLFFYIKILLVCASTSYEKFFHNNLN